MTALLRISLAVCMLMLQACTASPSPAPSPEAAPAPAALPARIPAEDSSTKASAESDIAGVIPVDQASARVIVRDTWLELRDCELAYGVGTMSASMSLQLPSPCQFAKAKDGSVRVIESDGVSVLLVESSRREPTPLSGGAAIDCDTRLRAVIVSAKGVQLSRDTQKVATCAPSLWDEKMFHVLALYPVTPSER